MGVLNRTIRGRAMRYAYCALRHDGFGSKTAAKRRGRFVWGNSGERPSSSAIVIA